MTLHTLIIDDEPIALEKLRNYALKVPFLELKGACCSAREAMAILADEHIDLIFTDIDMPDLSGMELVASLPAAPMVVFTTAHARYAVDSYRLAAVDYLLKPYSFVDFQRAATRALERASMRTAEPAPAADSLFVKVDYRYVRVATASIRYIKGYGEYLQIFTEGAPSPLLTLSSFAAIAGKLPAHFVQVHRSYIVNMHSAEQISRGRIVMDADTYIPVGDSYKATLHRYLRQHSVGAPKRSDSC